eukprot:scaffold2712_cov247-Chaetoceros_neogracile.AAC.1
MSPVTRVRPVLVIPDFARRANCPAVRRSTAAMPSWVGSLTGAPVGAFTGALNGAFTGTEEGPFTGAEEGPFEGIVDGISVEPLVGDKVSSLDGDVEGDRDGRDEGSGVGKSDGDIVGVSVLGEALTAEIVGDVVTGVPVGDAVFWTAVGFTTVAEPIVTAVCTSAAPFMLLPVRKVIAVAPRNTPSTWDPTPMTIAPETCQKMFFAWAPPVSTITAFEAVVKVPVICIIQISVELPLK